MIRHKRILPPAHLADYVYYFGQLEDSGVIGKLRSYKLIVDGCPGLIFQTYPDSFADKSETKFPQLFIHGVSTKPSEKVAAGRCNNIGVYFKPHAIKSLFNIDASELTDKYVGIDDLLKTDVTEKILGGESMEQKFAIISDFLTRQLAASQARQKNIIAFAIDRMTREKPAVSISNISSSLNLSERALERMFKAYIGITPKLFSRISRFKKTLHYIRHQKQNSLTSIAYDCDYADQSHWIREFKEFSGFTPKEYLRNSDEKLVSFPDR